MATRSATVAVVALAFFGTTVGSAFAQNWFKRLKHDLERIAGAVANDERIARAVSNDVAEITNRVNPEDSAGDVVEAVVDLVLLDTTDTTDTTEALAEFLEEATDDIIKVGDAYYVVSENNLVLDSHVISALLSPSDDSLVSDHYRQLVSFGNGELLLASLTREAKKMGFALAQLPLQSTPGHRTMAYVRFEWNGAEWLLRAVSNENTAAHSFVVATENDLLLSIPISGRERPTLGASAQCLPTARGIVCKVG